MDPLSITTGVLTCMSATSALLSTVKKLHHLRKAPEEIEELENEISALRANIEDMGNILGTSRTFNIETLRRVPIGSCIEKGRKKAETINNFLRESLLQEESEHKLKKSAWLRWQTEYNRLRQELRDVRIELGTCMSFFNAAGALHNEYQIEQLAVEGRAMHDRHAATLKALQEDLARQRPALAEEMEQQLTGLKQTIEATLLQATTVLTAPNTGRRHSQDLPPFYETINDPVEYRPRSKSTGSAPGAEEQSLARGTSSTTDFDVVTRPRHKVLQARHTSGKDPLRLDAASEPTIALQLSQRQLGRCKGPCSCQCHRSSRLKTPDFLRQVTGQLLIGYAGISSITPACNEHACASRQKSTVRIQYHFPVWSFIQRVLTLVSYSAGARGPEKVLRLSRIRPGLHEVFLHVQSGDIRRLELLFQTGEASPLDATDTGWTLLHYALMAKQLPTARFLKDSGADLYAETNRRDTPFDIAWNRILSGYVDQSSELALREIFSDTEHLDERSFTTLHKIVLGMIGRDLRSELETSTSQIDIVDNSGYSPLAWAAARGDVNAVSTLLYYGASVAISNNLAEQPMHLAAQTGNAETVRTLVNAGADINAEVRETHMTPMHYAAEYQDKSDHIQSLVDLKARVNAGDYMRWTPLHWASWRGHSNSLEALIERGADIHLPALNNYLPIMLAVANNSHTCIYRLIAAGADCSVLKDTQWNLLHYAAIGGSVDTLRALATGDLSDINIHSLKTTDTNQTVTEMLAQRLDNYNMAGADKQEERCEWEEAWKKLMEAARPVPRTRTNSISSLESSNDDAVYADVSPSLFG